MKLSIITINYNNKEGLQRTIDSVLSQTFTDYEWIIIDGGSTDGSKELIVQYQKHFAYWCSEPDNGVYNAMNKGVVYAKGEYLNFMNSGDEFYESTSLSNTFSVQRTSDILYGRTLRIRVDGTEYERDFPHPLTLDYWCKIITIGHQASFIKLNCMRTFPYDERMRICADLKFFMHCYLEGKTFEYLDFIVSRFYEGGLSADGMKNWAEGSRVIQDELSAKYLPAPFYSLVQSYYKRRLFRRLITAFSKVLERFS